MRKVCCRIVLKYSTVKYGRELLSVSQKAVGRFCFHELLVLIGFNIGRMIIITMIMIMNHIIHGNDDNDDRHEYENYLFSLYHMPEQGRKKALQYGCTSTDLT